MHDLLNTIIPTIFSGTITGVFTIISMRKDISWLKEWLSKIEARIIYLEQYNDGKKK